MTLQGLGFTDLYSKVISPNRCSGCATCVIACPHRGVLEYRDEGPALVGDCKHCEICVKACPRYDFDAGAVEERAFGRRRGTSEDFGISRTIAVARSTSGDVLKHAQDGGVATALLKKALEDGVVEAALVSGVDTSNPWVPVPKVASSSEDLIHCAGTRYSYSPNLLALPEALRNGFKRIAVVGTPCTISGVRKMQLLNLKLSNPIKLLVGLLCNGCFSFDCLMKDKMMANQIDLPSVVKVNIKGKLLVELRDGTTRELSLKDIKPCSRKSCAACDDFSSEYADVSLGGVGLSGSTLVVTRSSVGEGLLLNSLGPLKVEGAEAHRPSLELVSRLSRAKRARAAKFAVRNFSF